MANAGWITIGTKLKTDKFDKELAKLDTKINKAEKTKEVKLKAKVVAKDNLEQQKQATFELEKQYENASKELERLQNLQARRQAGGNLTPQQFTDLGNLSAVEKAEANIGNQLDRAYFKQQQLSSKVESTTLAYQKSADAVTDLKSKIESIKLSKQQAEIEKVKNSFNAVGSSIQNSVKQVNRMVLGIFGIRTAVMALRSASSTLSQYDQQYASNLEYIRFVLAQMIAPTLKWIINLAGTLLNYLHAILNAWFGIGKKTDVSAKNFKKMKTSASSTAKETKEIENSIAGFDEMNVLQDTSNKGSGSSGSDFTAPSLNIGEGTEVPKWVQWIADNKDLIISALAGIAAGVLMIKSGLSGIKALGIGIAVAGIVYTIQSLLAYLQDPSWENFGKIIQGVGITVIGVGVAIGSIPVIVAGAIILIVGTIVKYWEQIKAWFQKGIDWLKDKSDWIHTMFGDTLGAVYDNFVDILQQILNIFDSIFKTIKDIFDGFIRFIKGVFTGNWKEAWEGIKDIFKSLWEGIKGIVIGVINIIVDIVKSVGTVIKNVFTGIWNVLKNGAQWAWNGIKSVFSNVGSFFGNMWNTIKEKFTNIGQKIGNAVGGAFKGAVNAVLATIERVLNTPIRAVNKLIGVINKVPGINLGYLSTFNLPRLAVGGIVNMPNKGVNIGGAIAGESGREGVLPLTDTQAMQTLGQEIGKYITINATIENNMNGRVIARKLQQIKTDNDFAYNT